MHKFLTSLLQLKTLLALFVACGAQVSFGHETEWLKQFGTPKYDAGTAIARHSTGVYVTGYQTALPQQDQSDSVTSGFLRRYDASGIEVWAREFAFGRFSTTPYGIAVDDTGVYVSGASDDGAFVQKYDLSGQSVWTHFFQASDPGALISVAWAVAVHSTGVYVAGVSGVVCDPQFLNCHSNALVSRLDLAGNEIWVKIAGTPFDHPFGYRTDASADGIAVDATGVYVTGALGTADVRRYDFNGNRTGKFGTGTLWGSGAVLDASGVYITGLPCPPQCQFASSVRKFDRNGTVLWTRELPAEQANAIAGDGESVYVTGYRYLDFPQGPINAYVYRYASDGDLVSTDQFGAEPGTSSNNGYGIAADGTGVYVTGQTTGTFPGQVSTPNGDTFVIKRNENVMPQVRALSLGDLNHNGSTELAVVGHTAGSGTPVNWVVIKDTRTRATVRKYQIEDALSVADAKMLPDVNGNGAPEIVLLSATNHRATVHDSLSGTLLVNTGFNSGFTPVHVASLPDQNGNGAPELAVLQVNGSTAQVEIRDARSGAFIRQIALVQLQPRDLAVLPDLNQNGSAELAVLGRSAMAGKPDRVAIHDGVTGQLIRNVTFGMGSDPQQLVVVPDINGNASQELAVLREGTMRVVVTDSQTGEPVSVLTYSSAYRPFDLEVIPDFNGNGLAEIALWAVRPADGKVMVTVSDVATRQWLVAAYFGVTTAVRADAGAVISDLNGNGVPELVRAGVRGSDSNAVAGFRDASTGAAMGGEIVFQP